jgi:hypothetical protein
VSGEAFTPFGNNMGGFGGGLGGGSCCGGGGGAPFVGNWLGSVCEIPLCQIVCFTHSAI